MGFFTPDDDPGIRGVLGRAPVVPDVLPPGAVGDAAFRQDNTVVNVFRSLSEQRFPVDQEHNPLDVIRGTPFEQQYLDRFVGSQSEPETRAIMSKIEGEEKDRQVLEGAGFAGIVAQMIAGTLDPTIALPAGQIVRAGRGGYSLVKSAASIGAAGGVQALTQESILQATQETRPLSQSAIAVGSATVLASLLGSGAAKLLSKAEREVMEAGLDRARADMDAHAGNVVPPYKISRDSLDPQAGWELSEKPTAIEGIPKELTVSATIAPENYAGASKGDVVVSLKDARGKAHYEANLTKGGTHDEGPLAGQQTLTIGKIENTSRQFSGLGAAFYIELAQIAESRGAKLVTSGETSQYAQSVYRVLEHLGFAREIGRVNDLFRRYVVDSTSATAPPPLVTPGAPLAAAAGAAATDTRRLDLVPTGTKLETLGTDPMTRIFNSETIEGRRAAADLAETPLLMQQNLRGETTTLNGPPVNRRAILELNQGLIKVGDELDRLFGQMRGDSGRFLRARAWFDGKFGEGGTTMETFKREVSGALMSGDQHAIPEVAEAASFIRNNVLQKWGERAEAAIPEFKMKEFDDGESYFPHLFDKAVVRARRPEFTNVVVSHLEADQRVKAGIKQNLEFQNAQLQSWEKQIAKLEARFGRAEERAKLLDARAAERSRDDMPKIGGFNEPDLTGRVAELQRRKSEVSAEAKDLADAIDLMKEMSAGQTAIPMVLKRTVEQLERRTITERIVGAQHQEAGRGAKRSEKRLAALEEQLDKTETRKDLIEEYLAVAQQFHDEVRAKIEGELGGWHGTSAAEAKAAIKAREQQAALAGRSPDEPRLRAADRAIDRAVARIIESDRDLSIDELRGKANEITNHVLGSPDGRLPYDMHTGGPQVGWTPQSGEPPRGSLARRDFAIPTTAIRDFIETDVEHVVRTHLRTMVPDVLIAERFGDTRMTEALRKVEDEYAAKIDAAGPGKAAEKLGKQRERTIGDIAAVRDRIRGVYGADIRAAMPMLARAADAAKNFNYITSMGSATISSLPDMAGAVFRHGLGNVFREAWAPYFQGLTDLASASREQARQLRSMGIMVETDLAMRVHELNDITATHKPQSRLERTLQFGADKFGLVNLLAPWTDRMKAFAGGVAMSEILRATEAAAKGTASAKQIRTLGEANIDPHMADRIHGAFTAEGAGEIRDGVHLPNTERWTDSQAREAFEAAVAREADIAVVTPGQEKPRWLSNPVVGILGQFKSFAMAATQRILIANLQRADAEVLHGLVLSVGLGMLSYKLNGLTGGTKTSDRPQDWFREGISKSGITGWLEEGNALASKAAGGKLDAYRILGSDKPLTRFASRSAMDQVLGPTAGKLENMLKATSAAGRMDWKESDTKALRRVIPTQNLFYLRRLFDQVEAGANGAFGIEMKVKP